MYKLSREIKKEERMAATLNAFMDLIVESMQAGRRFNGDTVSDAIYVMKSDDFQAFYYVNEEMLAILEKMREDIDAQEAA